MLASALLFLVSLLWSAVIPGFRTPDELQHLNSVVRVAEGGGWPRPGEVFVEDELLEAEGLSGAATGGRRTVFPGGVGPIAAEARFFPDLLPTGVADRASFHALDDGPVEGGPVDQMTQHPPGYYAVAALVYDALGAGEWRYDRAMFLLRALTALTIAGTVPACCYVAGRALTGRSSVGEVAAFVPLLIPVLHFIGGGVTNDGAAIATTAVMWAALFTITCSGPTRKRLLVLAIAVAAACWTKGTAVAVLPAVPLAIAVAYRRARGGTLRHWGRPALIAAAGTSGLAFLLGGWWWALNLIRYGRVQPAAYQVPGGGDVELLSLPEFALTFLARIRWTFFGEVGPREHASLRALTMALAILFVVLVAAGLFSRRRLGDRLVILLAAGASVGVLFATTYSGHLQTNRLQGIQGRYLFVLLVPIAVLVAVGLTRIAPRLRFRASWLLPGIALAGFGVSAAGIALGFRIYYAVPGRPVGEAIDRYLAWAAWPPTVLGGLLAAFLLTGLALVWSQARGVRRLPSSAGAEPSADSSPAVPGRPTGGNKEFHVTETS